MADNPIKVKAYGKVLNFPAGTAPEAIEQALAEHEPSLNPEYKPPEPEALDYAKGFASGANKLVSGVGFLAEAAGAKETGKAIREFGDRGAKYWNDKMSAGGKLASKSQVFVDDDNEESITGIKLSDDWGKALLMSASQSLPSMFAAAIPGVAVTKGIQALAKLGLAGGAGATIPLLAGTAAPVGVASNIIARAPSAIGFGASEGVVAGAMNASEFKASIEGMTDEELSKSPVYRALKTEHDPETARSMLAEQAALDLFGKTAVSTGAIGALTGGGALSQAYQKVTSGAKTGLLGTVIKGAGSEALQEGPQSGGEQYIQNLTTKNFLDPTKDTTEGVATAAASGAAVGGFMGGVVGGGSAVNITPDRRAQVLNEKRKLAEMKASTVNARQQEQDMADIGAAQDIDQTIAAATKATSRPVVHADDVLRTEDPTLADIEKLTGLKPTEAIDTAIGEINDPQPQEELKNVDTQTQQKAPTKTTVLDETQTGDIGGTGTPTTERVVESPVPKVKDTSTPVKASVTDSKVLDAETFKASNEKGADYTKYLRDHPNREQAAKVDAQVVESNLVKGLQKTGKFTATDSKTYAKPFSEFYRVNAERQGILPSELYERMPLKFSGKKAQTLSQDARVTPASRNVQNFDLKDATPEDFTPENVGSLVNRKNWAVLTAANPDGKAQDDSKNLEANKALQKELADRGLAFEVVKGRYPGDKTEMESYLVYGIDQKAANELGNKYGQDSVLTREGLVYKNGKVTPVKAVGKGKPDGYTKVIRTGARFAFDMDWDRERGVNQGALSLVGRHYSKEHRKALEGSRFGQGLPGKESDRVRESDDPRLKSRVDFYVDTGEGVTPEAGLGNAIHEKLLHNIYDASTNPKRFKFPSDWLGGNVFEKQVLDAGYDGYFTKQGKQGRVVVLGDAAKSIPIEDTNENEQGRESELLSQSSGENKVSRESDGSLQGLPRNIGQFNASLHKKAEKVAKDYMKSAGLEYNPPNSYATVNVPRAERIAQAFEEMKHDPQNPEVKAAYDALVKETTAQYKAVIDSGLKVEFIDFDKTGDPYAGNPRAMTEDVRKNNHMWVFSTRDGFGSSDFDPADNPLLAETEFEISGQKALVNDLFRVVHDYFGHVKEGVGFRAAGEENAWRAHMAMFSPLAGRALTTETRGQNSWVNYGPFAEFNKTASGADTKYADQKIGLLPEWASTEGRADETEEYNQSVKLSNAKETLKKYGLKPDGKYSTRQVAAALEARQRAKFGSIEAGDYSKESLDKIASWMAEEVNFEMQNPQDSGVGWYSEKFQRALDALAVKHPELADDKNARNTMTALIAITSDGQKVGDNLRMAEEIYNRYSKTGKLATTNASALRNSFEGNVKALQGLYDRMGVEDTHKFLLEEKTLSELKKLAAEHGETLTSPYQADFKLPMATLAFGPKLGAFYANLMGSHGYLTMDRWWSRTFNRYRGTLLQSPTGSGLSTFRELIGQEGLSDDETVAATVAPRGAYEARGFKTQLAELVGSSEPATDKAKVNWMETAKAKAGARFPELLKEHNIERAANTIYKKAFENLEDAPFGAKDRTFMSNAAKAAQVKLAKKGLHPSIADIQAILWYYEKKLYGKMGATQSGVISYEDAARRLVSGKADGPDIEGGVGATATGLGNEEVSIGDEDFGESYAQSNFYSALEKDIVVDGVKRPTTNSEGKPISNPINFWKWFRDSEARQWPESSRGDRKMAPPLVFYHGTKGDFNEFVVGSPGTNSTVFGPWETHRAGMFFTQDKKFAESFSTQGDSKQGANVMPVYLKVENAIDLTDGFTDDAVIDALAEKGVNPRLMRNISADQIWGMFDKEDDGDFFVSKLKELGYDGAIIVEPNQATDESVESWVAFNPNQIKSAIGNNGEFDRNDPNILKQSNFYSALEKEIVNLKKIANKNGEVSVEQAKAWINSRQKEGKFKQAEVEAVGLNDWLDTLEGKVPVTDVEKFVQENGVQVEEVVLEGEGGVELDEDKVYDEAYQDFVDVYELPEGTFDQAISEVADEMLSNHNDGRWGGLIGLNDEEEVEAWLEDEEVSSTRSMVRLLNSRYGPEEVLGTDGYNDIRDAQEQNDWERNQDYYLDQARERLENEAGGGSGGTEFGQYVLREGDVGYKELLLTLPKSKAKFNAPHFDRAQDDGAENIFAHTRINERYVDAPMTDEEIAAKKAYAEWQAGNNSPEIKQLLKDKEEAGRDYRVALDKWKEKAVRDTSISDKQYEEAISTLSSNPPDELKPFIKRIEEIGAKVKAKQEERLAVKPPEPARSDAKERVLFVEEIQSDWAQKGRDEGFATGLTKEEQKEFDDLNTELYALNSKELTPADQSRKQDVFSRIKELKAKRSQGIPTAPFVTDTKAWTGLVAKRLLRYAAENGFDRIAWTAGAQQAERYRLSKFVDRVTANRSDDGKYYVKAVTEDGKTVAADFYEADKLAGTFGKELADKIISQPEGEQVYSGLDLDVGGSGMKEFYDRIVPSVFNDISRKLGGDKVETISMGGQSGKVVTGLEGRIVIAYPNGSYLKNRNTGVMTESQDRADRFDSREEATKFLDKFESQNLHDVGRQMSLAITPALKEKVMQGLPLFQRDRAGYNPNTFTISLMDGSDMSSVIHEGGHFYLEALADMASQPNAPKQIVDDFDTTLQWFGLGDQVQDSAEPATRAQGYPTEAGEPIATFRKADEIKSHPSYTEAKAGSDQAAFDLVNDLVTENELNKAKERFVNATFVPVSLLDKDGANRIPTALAYHYANATGGSVSDSIFESKKAYHTGMNAMERLVSRANFSGKVEPGRRYVLVDDVTTVGSTLADLASYIQENGGEVIGSVLLANATRSGNMFANAKTLKRLEVQYGNEIRELFKIEPNALTQEEAQYLIGFRNADELRGSAIKAQGSRLARIHARKISKGQSSVDQQRLRDIWQSMTLEQKRPYHEQWAQSFELYAMEGVSPTEEMQPVFERFKQWMLETYKSLKEFLKNNPLAGRLNNEVRQVFDRLLASDADIAATAASRSNLKQSGKQNTPTPETGSTPPAATPKKPFNPNEDIPETRFRKAQRLSQDSFNRFTVIKEWLEERGVKLSEKADVFQAEERYNSLVANQLEDFREQQRNPLIEKVAKAGFTMADVADFLEAQHAEEANIANRKLTGLSDSEAFGISDVDAKAYLAKADPKLAKLANELRDITEQSKQMRLDAGLLSQDEVDAMDAAYKFYIPVKGDADAKGGTGKGLKVNFKSKRRLGHGKRSEAVIENIFLDHERAIMQIEKNRVAKHLVMMAAEMNMPEIVSVGQPVKRNTLRNKVAYEVQVSGVTRATFDNKQAADMFKQLLPTIDKSVQAGMITVDRTTDQRIIAMASPMLAENEINVYIDGHAIRLQINDDLLARAYGKLGVTGFSALVSAGRAFNGYLSKVYTGYNPEFILTNMIRDFSSGLINLTGEEGGKIALKASANYVKSFGSLMKYAISNGKKSDKWIDMYRANGGNTGAAYLSDLERLGDEVKTEYAAYQGVLANLKSGDIANASRAAGRKAFNVTLKWIYNLNQAGENAMRLAAFRAMIESGKTKNEAAKAAKNITVNFNRKGELGAEANAAYLFFNASVQGTAALAHAHFKGKHKAQAWGLSSMVGVLGYLAAMALIGDDEDDYDKINDYTKSRNFMIKAGDGYAQIPVPYGYGFFWNTGRAIAEAQHKGELGKLPWHMAASAIEELTPFSDTVVGPQDGFQFDQVLLGMLPTVIKIPAQPAFNKQLFSGGEMFPERASQQFQPDREKLWRSTQGTMYDKLAGWLSDAGLGDVSPETLKHYTQTATGGTGALVDATVSATMLKKEGAELEPSEIPFARKAYSKITIKEHRAAYYKAREEAQKTAEAFSRAKVRNDVTTIDKLIKDEGEMIGLDAYANSLSEAIGAVRDMQDAIRLDEGLNAAEKRVQIKELEITEQKFYDQYLDVFKIEKLKMKERKD